MGCPIAFGDEELDSFEPLLPLRLVPFWTGLRWSRTREAEDSGERRGGVARADGPAGPIDEAGGPAGLGSWTADAGPDRRLSDSAAYESGSSLRTLVMRRLALCEPTG